MKFDGQGTYVFANGDTYTGEFKESKVWIRSNLIIIILPYILRLLCQKHGHGTFKSSNGGSFVGDYVDDMVTFICVFLKMKLRYFLLCLVFIQEIW